MRKILVAAHGKVASFLLEALENLVGKLENFYAINLLPNEGIDDFTNKIRKVLNPEDEAVIFVDFLGGTPCNCCLRMGDFPSAKIISGLNLPMLLEAFFKRNEGSIEDLSKVLIQAGKDSIVDVREVFHKK